MESIYTVLLVAHTVLVLFLIVVILLQRSEGGGLGGLGGGGGNQFMTGRGTANFMTRTTSFLAVAFMCTSLALATMASRMSSSSIVDEIAVKTAIEKGSDKDNNSLEDTQKPVAPAIPKPE
ncbi:MAG: preprotein translocase subunit SecG [Rickettsiales bacterium]